MNFREMSPSVNSYSVSNLSSCGNHMADQMHRCSVASHPRFVLAVAVTIRSFLHCFTAAVFVQAKTIASCSDAVPPGHHESNNSILTSLKSSRH